MIKFTLIDDTVRYVRTDLVHTMNRRPDGFLGIRFRKDDGEMGGFKAKDFMIVSTGKKFS
jgi:hypothetical protein